MGGAETVLSLALQFDWATSSDRMNAFNHVKVEEAFQQYLCFMHWGRCYKYLVMPLGARHNPRIFTTTLGHALAYIRAHWEVRSVALEQGLSAASNAAANDLVTVFGVDTVTGKVRVYSQAGHRPFRLAMVFQHAFSEEDHER
jgi:hypothetical protein